MRRFFLLLSAVTMLAALTATTPAGAAIGVAPARLPFVPRQVVVKFKGSAARAIGLPRGSRVLATARALRRNPRVVYAEPNYIATASAKPAAQNPLFFKFPNDPGSLGGPLESAPIRGGWSSKQWNFLPKISGANPGVPYSPGGINALGAWENLAAAGDAGAPGVVVAVLDTGVAYKTIGTPPAKRSPDFYGQRKFVTGANFVGNARFAVDYNGHGTHVAGTIAESTGNGLGLTGLAYRARLMPVRVLNAEARGNAVAIAKGIRFATENGADVINMSFNFECGDRVPIVSAALARARAAGIVLVASAGNTDAETCISAPADMKGVIAVGATTEGGCLADYSPSGPEIDIVAPGGGQPGSVCQSILARPIYQVTLKPGTTDEFAIPGDYTGTSMAAAHVSGVAAMLLSLEKHAGHPLHTRGVVKRVRIRLMRTTDSLELPRNEQGAGLLDAERATDLSFPTK